MRRDRRSESSLLVKLCPSSSQIIWFATLGESCPIPILNIAWIELVPLLLSRLTKSVDFPLQKFSTDFAIPSENTRYRHVCPPAITTHFLEANQGSVTLDRLDFGADQRDWVIDALNFLRF
jgi:hypothetical protein